MDNSNLQQKISSLCRDFTCGFCEAQLGYKIQFSDHSETYAEYGDFISGGACAVVSCNHCNRLNILLFDVDVDDYGPSFPDSVSADLYEAHDPEILNCWWDKDEHFTTITFLKYRGQIPSARKFSRNIPEAMSSLVNEAENCLTVGSLHAATVMCRRVLEQLVRHLGIKRESKTELLASLLKAGHIDEFAFKELSKEPTLYQDIQQAKAEGKVDPNLYQALTETRKWGNLGAHIDADFVLSHSDTVEVVHLTSEILEYVFSTERLTTKTEYLSQRRPGEKPS